MTDNVVDIGKPIEPGRLGNFILDTEDDFRAIHLLAAAIQRRLADPRDRGPSSSDPRSPPRGRRRRRRRITARREGAGSRPLSDGLSTSSAELKTDGKKLNPRGCVMSVLFFARYFILTNTEASYLELLDLAALAGGLV